MDLTLKGSAKEIASLVLELQGRQGAMQLISGKHTPEDRDALAQAITAVLLEQSQHS